MTFLSGGLAAPDVDGDPSLLRRRARARLLAAAVAAIETDQPAAADAPCAALLAVDPRDADALLLHALAAGLAGDVPGAARRLDRVRRARPANAHPCHTLVELLCRHGRPADAAAHLAASLALAPADDGLRVACADRLHEAGDAQAALEMLEPMLERADCDARARVLAAVALADAGQFAAAIAQLRRAVARAPDQAIPWSNLGMLLKVEGAFNEAVAAADRAVALAPDQPQIRLNRAITLLRAGRMAEAWDDYECRLRLPGRNRLPPERLLPCLATLPPEALAGRTVLLTHEEGFGDTLQFLRYAPLLAARGMRVLLWVPVPLARLLAGAPGVERRIVAGEPVPPTDYHCPVFSLPRAFETTLDTIPPPLPYRADDALVRRWGDRLPPAPCRVGLVWAGQARPWLPGFSVLDGRRSIGLDALAPLGLVDAIQFISLQAGQPAAQAGAPPAGLRLHDPMPDVGDFADTAAIVAHLDAVVSVDTSVAHLAASTGKPVLLLDRYDSCWRWLAGRDDSPWYPSLRIFRQRAVGSWAEPVACVATALRAIAPH